MREPGVWTSLEVTGKPHWSVNHVTCTCGSLGHKVEEIGRLLEGGFICHAEVCVYIRTCEYVDEEEDQYICPPT
jgi:hypothetical protein